MDVWKECGISAVLYGRLLRGILHWSSSGINRRRRHDEGKNTHPPLARPLRMCSGFFGSDYAFFQVLMLASLRR